MSIMDATKLCMGCMGESHGAAVCPVCQWDANAPAESPLYLNPRTVLNGQYLVGRVLGHGGFGITYIGWDLNLTRKIAIKEYFPAGIAMRPAGERVSAYSGAMQKDFQWGLERYLEEARVLARFDHPNISSVSNFFSANGTAYMILDYLDGMTFEKFLERRGGSAPWETVAQVMVPVMDALREVHKSNILHRDISPDNIYILKTGQIKVIDFGAARYALGQQSKNLSIILKEGYAPEEQYRSKGNQGPWTDVYATAATMYRALTGIVPVAALDRQRTDELVPPSSLGVYIPPGKERALWKALAVQAEDRFQSMADFENAVLTEETVASQATVSFSRPTVYATPVTTMPPPVKPLTGLVEPVPTPPTPIPAPVPPKPKRPMWLIALAAFVALVVVAVAMTISSRKPPVIASFSASPASLTPGATVTLQWGVDNATPDDIVTITPGVGTVAAGGTTNVQPAASTTYTLTVKSKDGKESRKTVQVAVNAPAGPQIIAFQAEPSSVDAGQPIHLRWSVKGADTVEIQGLGTVPAEGEQVVTPQQSGGIVLTATGGGKQATQTASIIVNPPVQTRDVAPNRNGTPPPQQQPRPSEFRVIDFGVNPPSIAPGQQAMLHWNVIGAASVTIVPAPGRVEASGQMPISPAVSTRYQLIAANARGQQLGGTAFVNVAPVRSDVERTVVPPYREPVQQLPAPALSWVVFHDHDGILGFTLNRYRQEWHYCEGQLAIVGSHLRYTSRQFPAHNFDVPLSEVEVKTIRRTIQGRRAFEVKVSDGGHYNFVSQANVDGIIAAIQHAAR
jgi:serine/threonine protein kinase